MSRFLSSDSSHEQDLSFGAIFAITLVCLAAYIPLADTGILNDDRVFLDYAERLTWNPARAVVGDYVFHGQVLKDFVVFESTHPPLIPYYLRFLQKILGPEQWANQLWLMHLAFAPFLIMAAVGLAGLIRRTTEQPGWLALALVLGPLFLPNAMTFMADVPLFAFWVCGLWFWERAMDRSGRAAAFNYGLAWWCAFCALMTAYQGLGLIALMALRGVGRGRVGETLIMMTALMAPFLLWLWQVYYHHQIFPYFAPPREELSIATEVHKGLVLENVWAKTRVMLIYLGAALGLFAPFSTAFRNPTGAVYAVAACLGWGWVMVVGFVGDGAGFPGWFPWLLTALGLAFVPLPLRALKELATDREYALWWFTLLVWAGGLAVFQIFLAAFASPRYNLLLFAAAFLALLKTLPAVPAVRGGLLLATFGGMALGWIAGQSERTYSLAQNPAQLPLTAPAEDIHFVGEMGVRFYGERLGMNYLLADQGDQVRYLLVPERTDRIAVPEQLRARAEKIEHFEVGNPWPLQLRNPERDTNFYVHPRGFLPFRFGFGYAERFDLYRVYQPVLPVWQPKPADLRPLGPITAQSPFAMDFTTSHDGLMRLRLNLATYNRINQSTLEILIEQPADDGLGPRTLWRHTLDAAKLQDNQWVQIDFEALDSANRPLRLTVTSPDATVDSAVTLWIDGAGNQPFTYAGAPQSGRPAVEMFCLPRGKKAPQPPAQDPHPTEPATVEPGDATAIGAETDASTPSIDTQNPDNEVTPTKPENGENEPSPEPSDTPPPEEQTP